MIESYPSTLFIIDLQLCDGATNKFVQANIKTAAGITIQTQSLTHKGGGIYTVQTTLSTIGSYTVQCVVYTDAGFTIEDLRYDNESEQILIEALPLSAGDVWNYSPRSLTEDVNVGNPKEYANVWMTTGVISTTKTQEIMAWLEIDNLRVLAPTSCSIQIVDSLDNLKHDFGLSSSPSADGFFKYLKPNADTVLLRAESYIAIITIIHNSKTYSAMRGITVLF